MYHLNMVYAYLVLATDQSLAVDSGLPRYPVSTVVPWYGILLLPLY
eukprot:SAG11_NODE_1872_length_4150_cov_3.248087_1_plen_46_part_00